MAMNGEKKAISYKIPAITVGYLSESCYTSLRSLGLPLKVFTFITMTKFFNPQISIVG